MVQFTWEEIKKHNLEDDAWVVVNGSVFDVTKFASIHPGGREFIIQHAGQNITETMIKEDVHIHSEAAYSLLETYKIGTTTDERTAIILLRAGQPCKLRQNPWVMSYERDPQWSKRSIDKPKSIDVDYQDDDSLILKGWKEDTVDWNQGLVMQVHKYGHDYLKWVHSPVDKQLKLFSTQLLEFFSKTPWYFIPIVWLPVILILAFHSYHHLDEDLLLLEHSVYLKFVALCLLMICGFFTWTLVEYILHRYLFHLTPPGDSVFWITMHFFLHGQHHKVPFDPGRLVFPPVAAMVFALPFYLLFTNIFPVAIGEGIFAGGLFGYLVYDMTHYYVHHGQPKPGSYLYQLKQYHLKHHFENQSLGFGISSPFWDTPFGTSPTKKE